MAQNIEWGSHTGIYNELSSTYSYKKVPIYNKHTISVNNNLKAGIIGEFKYKDGTSVPEDTDIHIHSGNIVMTGATHDKNSIQIYPSRKKSTRDLRKIITTIREKRISTATKGGY